MVDNLGKFLLSKPLLILGIEGLKLVMRLKFLSTKTWVLVELGGLKDLRGKSLKKGVGGSRRKMRRGVVSLKAGSGEIAAAATGGGKMGPLEMGLMRMVMRGH